MAISVSGAMHNNYGHFLLDGLPIVYLLANAARQPLVIACPQLAGWQRQILALLNLDEMIRVLDRPTRFKTLIGSSCLSQHVARPTRYARAVFDALRFVVPFAPDAPEKLFIIRAGRGSRVMNNADELKERMIKRGYTTVVPENYSIVEQIQMFSRAKVIVGATGAGMANVGFAPPGAKIVDIMAECRPDQWLRNLSFVLGHRWYGYVHRVGEIRGGYIGAAYYPLYDFNFDLPLDDFEEALSAIESA